MKFDWKCFELMEGDESDFKIDESSKILTLGLNSMKKINFKYNPNNVLPIYQDQDFFNQKLLQLKEYFITSDFNGFYDAFLYLYSCSKAKTIDFYKEISKYGLAEILFFVAFSLEPCENYAIMTKAVKLICNLCKNPLFIDFFIDHGIFDSIFQHNNFPSGLCIPNNDSILHYFSKVLDLLSTLINNSTERMKLLFPYININSFIPFLAPYSSTEQFKVLNEYQNLAIRSIWNFFSVFSDIFLMPISIQLLVFVCYSVQNIHLDSLQFPLTVLQKLCNFPEIVQVLMENDKFLPMQTFFNIHLQDISSSEVVDAILLLLCQIYQYTDKIMILLDYRLIIFYLHTSHAEYSAIALQNMAASEEVLHLLISHDIVPIAIDSFKDATFNGRKGIISMLSTAYYVIKTIINDELMKLFSKYFNLDSETANLVLPIIAEEVKTPNYYQIIVLYVDQDDLYECLDDEKTSSAAQLLLDMLENDFENQ